MIWTYRVRLVGYSGTVTVAWSPAEVAQIPSDYAVALADGEGDAVADMRTASEYSFTAQEDATYEYTIQININESVSNQPTQSGKTAFPFFPSISEQSTEIPTIDEILNMADDEAADIIEEMNVTTAADVIEVMSDTSAAGIVEAAVEGDQIDSISEVMLEMEQEATATVLLEVEPESGADVVESMAIANLTGAAERVEATIKKRLEAVDEDIAEEIMDKAVSILEEVTVESLVDLFVTIANLPATPSTVADVFTVMDLDKVLEVISAWGSTEAFEELARVLEYLPSEKLKNVYIGMPSSERLTIYPYFVASTASVLPSFAVFEVSGLSVIPDEVSIGENVAVSVVVSNVGEDSGSYTVDLMVNGVAEQSAVVTLNAGTMSRLSFTLIKNVAGVYSVEVAEEIKNVIVSAPRKPAEFVVFDLEISPMEVEIGGSITVSMMVSNIVEETGSYTIEVKLDDLVVDAELVTLGVEESTPVVFTVLSEDAGNHTIGVNELSGNFTVDKPPAKSLLAVVVVGGVLVVIVAVFFLQKGKIQGILSNF